MDAEARTAGLIRRSPRIREELLERAARGGIPELSRHGVGLDAFTAALDPAKAPGSTLESLERGGEARNRALEAIVRRYGRPVLLVRNGTYEPPELASVAAELAPHRAQVEAAVARVGRIEFVNHAMPWGGTGWLVERNVVITNRHVAELVAEPDGRGRFRFRVSPAGVPFGARLDFREEHAVAGARELLLTRVRYLARSDQPDVALLEIAVDGELPDPLMLAEGDLVEGQAIGVIGYPARDSRNDPDDVARYFGDVFDVKRLAPGEITPSAADQPFFMHDATTLGGNSGSVVLDLATGRALGLHFAGSYLVGNYAVTVAQIKRALRGLRTVIAVWAAGPARAEKRDGAHPVEHFHGRQGFEPRFLGSGARRVALPGLRRWAADAAEATDASGGRTRELKYTHFSVVFSASRKVPIFTAANIDGGRLKKIKRGDDQWFADLRLPASLQLGQRDYDHPDIDRGHMVRREDPNWGPLAVAQLANDDTFHYTNAAPQHGRLNQGAAQWLGLEDYVLGSARTHGLRISVFTGPVLRAGDPALDNGVQVPEEFWKVVVALGPSGALRATGYVLSQGQLIEDITEGFVYGQYRTYQVPVAAIAAATSLDLGALVGADPLRAGAVPETLPGALPVIALDRLESMVL
jgi:endonuclease G, mitochondrial